MYEAFYGLNEKPFNLTPDPRFLYLSEKHKEAFAHLLFGIKNRSGFVVVTGEIGTGKTTICRTLLNQLDPDTEVAFIFNPCLSPEELLRKINEDFGIATRARTVKGLIDELNAYLLDHTARGKNCVLVIDEAQDLTPKVLEQIRLLSNLETETQKLLQIVLIGQPELNQLLGLDELRQLDQRITARYHLKPLDQDETLQYIAYRLRVAGGRGRIHFTKAAVSIVFRISGGVPRLINAVCDRALLIGYTREVSDISAEIARQAAREVKGDPALRQPRAHGRFRSWLPNPTILAAAVLALVGGKYLVDRIMPPAPAPPAAMSERDPRTEHPVPWSQGLADASDTTDASGSLRGAPSVDPSRPGLKNGGGVGSSFADQLDAIDPQAALNAAAVEMLRRWRAPLQGSYPQTDSLAALAAFAQENGLSHLAFFPTIDQLTALDLPALVKVAGNRRTLWVSVVRVENGEIRITTTVGETMLVPRADFERLYLSQAVVLWRDPTPNAEPLRAGAQGEAVRTLQRQLVELKLFPGEPDGRFGEATVEAVKRLQISTGMNADGVAGQQTRLVLCSWSPAVGTPSLTREEIASETPVPKIAAMSAATPAGTSPQPSSGTEPEPQPTWEAIQEQVAASEETQTQGSPPVQPEEGPAPAEAAPPVPAPETVSPEPQRVPQPASAEAGTPPAPPPTAPEQPDDPEQVAPPPSSEQPPVPFSVNDGAKPPEAGSIDYRVWVQELPPLFPEASSLAEPVDGTDEPAPARGDSAPSAPAPESGTEAKPPEEAPAQ